MELTLFIIVGAVAIISAALMLLSENAIYSALFLILNFACIAFLFLMLNAPFLAMVQITVYAGAIMVLFLFVIMLLGAERVHPSVQPRFRWVTPAILVLALLFFGTVSVAIIDGDIGQTQPEQTQPYIRAVNAMDGVGPVDVYLGDVAIARNLAFHEGTSFAVMRTGEETVAIYAAGDDPAAGTPLASEAVILDKSEAVTVVAVGRSLPPGPSLVVASEPIGYNSKEKGLSILAVNGLPDYMSVDVIDETGARETLVDNLPYGEAGTATLVKGTYTIGLFQHGNDRTRLVALKDKDLKANTSVLMVFTEQRQPDNSFENVVITMEAKSNPLFGSPTHVGRLLFSRYVLPFEVVSLLLLVAMIGAIVLTHETLTPRRRTERRLANPPAGLEQPAIGDSSK
jgi:NADH-quinone oxidoreductase subunit J